MPKPTDKRFSELSPEDLRPWLNLPVTRLLEEHLVSQRDLTKEAIADYVYEGEEAKARIATGGLRAHEALLALFHPPDPPPVEPEEPFVDPGTIPEPPRGAAK